MSDAVVAFEAEAAGNWRTFGLPLGYHAQGRTSDTQAALAAMFLKQTGSEFQVAAAYAYLGDADQHSDGSRLRSRVGTREFFGCAAIRC